VPVAGCARNNARDGDRNVRDTVTKKARFFEPGLLV